MWQCDNWIMWQCDNWSEDRRRKSKKLTAKG